MIPRQQWCLRIDCVLRRPCLDLLRLLRLLGPMKPLLFLMLRLPVLLVLLLCLTAWRSFALLLRLLLLCTVQCCQQRAGVQQQRMHVRRRVSGRWAIRRWREGP